MKKGMTVCILLILVGAGVWYFAGNPTAHTHTAKNPQDKLHVVASNYAVYALAREVGGEKIDLSLLVEPGTEPHHFEPTPGTIIAVNDADLFIYSSAQAEPWVNDILKGLAAPHRLAAAPIEPEEDPHVWMTPYGALSMAKRITTALTKADPAYKQIYQANLSRFEQQMTRLHEDIENSLASCRHHNLVHVGHLAFAPLADAYGLKLSALSGTSHQGEHSVLKVTGMVRLIRGHHVPAVFTEEMLSPDLAQLLARETRVKLLPLYTIEEVSKEDFERGVTYEEYMRRNLSNLQEGLQCQA